MSYNEIFKCGNLYSANNRLLKLSFYWFLKTFSYLIGKHSGLGIYLSSKFNPYNKDV